MRWMPESVPCFGDLDLPRGGTTPTDRMRRTKSRAHQLCVWEGFLGTHDLFLGRWLRVAGHVAVWGGFWATALLLPWQHDIVRVVAVVLLGAIVVWWWHHDMHQLAAMPERASVFGGTTPTWWIALMQSSAHTFSWMTNRWGEQALVAYEKAYPDLPSEIVRWELTKRGRLLDDRPVVLPVEGRIWE